MCSPPPPPPASRFVTYKWPSWLHKQTEKQRIIWAYKILFLDVLFPLGLKKVGLGQCVRWVARHARWVARHVQPVHCWPFSLACPRPCPPPCPAPPQRAALHPPPPPPHHRRRPTPHPPPCRSSSATLTRWCVPTCGSCGTWTCRAHPTATPPSATTTRKWRGSGSGSRWEARGGQAAGWRDPGPAHGGAGRLRSSACCACRGGNRATPVRSPAALSILATCKALPPLHCCLQGFWREHLQGRPYHISALYVIDLERFRWEPGGCVKRERESVCVCVRVRVHVCACCRCVCGADGRGRDATVRWQRESLCYCACAGSSTSAPVSRLPR